MPDDSLGYYLGFSYFLGIGPIRFKNLITYFGSIELAYQAREKELINVVGLFVAKKFVEFRNNFSSFKEFKILQEKSIQVVSQNDSRYPVAFKNLSDPPICLFVKGDLKKWNLQETKYFIGIVGTRKPTSYGLQITNRLASELSDFGFVIVSGLAMGIDAAAHQAALMANGKTIAFLGCGVDIPYPRENIKIYDQIVSTGGLIISEFPPGRLVQKGLFIARNRLISGLSAGVLVVEGMKDSGSLVTARFAAEQGKTVFAPPSPITSVMSEAPNLLLKQGARLVTSVDDILSEFEITISPTKIDRWKNKLSKKETLIIDLLLKESLLVDEIVLKIGFSTETTLNLLSQMEIKGIVGRNNDGKYRIEA